MKGKKFLKNGLLTLFAASSFAAATAAIVLNTAENNEIRTRATVDNAVTAVNVVVDGGITVNYYVDLPEGYTEPQLVVGDNTVTQFTMDGEEYVFSYSGVSAVTMDDKINAEIKAKNGQGVMETVGSKETSVYEYWTSVFNRTQDDLGYDELKYTSMRSFVANFLNYGAKAQAHAGETVSITLTQDMENLLYAYDNIYSTYWDQRALTYTEGETDASGFEWIDDVTLDYSKGVALQFKFAVTDGTFSTLRAKVMYGSEVEEVKVEALPQDQQTLQGKTVYTFTTRAIKASEFSSQLGVRVYNGTQKISRRAIYSVNRCLDKLHYATSGTEQALIDAIYSYGKASAWFAYFGETDVTELPARWENGIYDLEIFDYRYDDARMLYTLPSYVWGDWTIWLNGETYTTGMSEPVVKEGYQVAYDGASNAFTVTLDGANIDGLVVTNVNLKIDVKSSSSVSGAYYRTWDDKNAKKGAAIAVNNGNITIVGEEDATLTVNGSVLTSGALVVENNAKVNVNAQKAAWNGVEASEITVQTAAALNVAYTGAKTSANTGVAVTSGNLVVNNATLTSQGFKNGVAFSGYTTDDSVRPTFTVDGENSIVSVKAAAAGVTFVVTAWGVDMNMLSNRQVTLNAGKITVDAAYGFNYADITLNAAELTINAHDGNGIGQDRAAKLTTTSGDYTVGKINIVCTQYNQWWNVYGRAISTDGMNINGGEIRMSVANRDSVIGIAADDTALIFDNCNVYLITTNDDMDNIESGIKVEKNNVTVTVQTAARVFVENAEQPVTCWLPASDTVTPLTLYIYGDMAGINCLQGISGLDCTTIIAEGRVR